MRGGGRAAGLQLGLARAIVEDEVLDEAAAGDVGQHALHLGLGLGSDDARPGLDVAIFGGVADRIAHVGDAAFIEQIDDQLGFVETFEIRSEEHTSELQSLMRISYAVFCLKNKNK